MTDQNKTMESQAAHSNNARFAIGEVIEHQRFGYRGVVVDVDPVFQGTDDWYDSVALSRPPKDEPWYHVLPHDAEHQTYVAERNLVSDASGETIVHPLIEVYFSKFVEGRYFSDTPVH